MREKKFRVRDADTKKVIGYERVNKQGHWESMRENRQAWLLGAITSEDDLIREQFSGMSDRRGKEMYENDIIECHEYDSSDTGRRIVQTFKNAVVEFGQGDYYYYPKGNMKQPHQLLMYAHKPIIIGNIYEHPELLDA
jgi:hypothetical protein